MGGWAGGRFWRWAGSRARQRWQQPRHAGARPTRPPAAAAAFPGSGAGRARGRRWAGSPAATGQENSGSLGMQAPARQSLQTQVLFPSALNCI